MSVYKNFNSKTPFFIAEISANHNGFLGNAKKLILSAKKYGADAVKIQTYTPETMTIDSTKKDFQIKDGLWKGKNLWTLYKEAQTPFEWQKKLFKYARKINIVCFSTPFDTTAVDLLEKINCPFYKVASFEMNDVDLIKKIALTKKPMIISTGMATLKEIDLAFATAKKNGCKNIALLYCVSNYPSKLTDFNFNNIKILKERYKCKIGFSDHSTDNKIVAAAIASGAEIIEKHIALPQQTSGPDIAFSIKGKDIAIYGEVIRKTYQLMGRNFFYRNKSEKNSLKFRRSIYAVKNIAKGEKFTKNNIRVIRPGYGIEPLYFEKLIGKKAPNNISAETPIKKKILNNLKYKL
jgi:pseudaminic acid synthase